MNKKILLVAGDYAPSECFEVLSLKLDKTYPELEIFTALGYGFPFHFENIDFDMLDVDFVLLGMSSSLESAHAEICTGIFAKGRGIPYGFYSDMPLCPNRAREGALFHELAMDAELFCGLFQSDVVTTSKLFPSARCVMTGNPVRDSMAFPRFSREEVREMLEVASHEKLILAPGGKFPAGNAFLWILIAEALNDSTYREQSVLVLSPHPNDPASRLIYADSRMPADLYRDVVANSPVRTIAGDESALDTLDIVAGADLVIEFSGSTSVCAAYQRIPVMSLTPHTWMNLFTRGNGESKIELLECSAAAHTDLSVQAIARTIRDFFTPHSPLGARIRDAQVTAYPHPVDANASIDALVATIANQMGL